MSDNDEKEKQPSTFIGDKYGISKPLTVLIEKISAGLKNLYAPFLAKQRVKAKKIESASESNKIQQTAEPNTKTREEENMEAIIGLAKEELPPGVSEENIQKIDKDWESYFSKNCGIVSNKYMQSILAKIYAGEATKPGTFSKRTIDIVSKLDKKDAILFTSFCQFVWLELNKYPIPIIYDTGSAIHKKKGCDFSRLQHLKAIGLVYFRPVWQYYSTPQPVSWYYCGTAMVLYPKKYPPKNNYYIPTGEISLTQSGEELFRIFEVEKNDEFFNYVINEWKIEGLNPAIQIPATQ